MQKRTCYTLFLLVPYLALLTTHLLIAPIETIQLFGDRTVAMFDAWSFQHLGSGILLGSLVTHLVFKKSSNYNFYLTLFAIALIWECMELLMEAGYLGHAVASWKKGYEHMANRFFGDVIAILIGGLISRKYSHAWIFFLPLCSLWLLVNVFFVEDSMTINQLFIDFFALTNLEDSPILEVSCFYFHNSFYAMMTM